MMRKTALGAASVLAALWLAGAVQAQEMGGDPPDELILVDPLPGDGLCDEGCLPVDVGVTDGSGDDEIIVIDDGWTDDRWTDDGWTDDGWTDEGWTDEGWTDEGGEDGGLAEGDPEVMYDTASDCGGCEMQSFGGAPRGPTSAAPSRNAAVPDFGPDLCIDHPPALNWICDWQVGRK